MQSKPSSPARAAIVRSIAPLLPIALAGCLSGTTVATTTAGEILPRPVVTPAADAPPAVNIGHRGASAYAPEHTIAAYDLALRLGADYIEQDLRMTSDSVLVVLHDPTLDRTTLGPRGACSGPVAQRTLEELRRCDAGLWFNAGRPEAARPEFEGLRVPTMEEVLQRYGARAHYYIEIKSPEEAPGMERALLALLERHALRGNRVPPFQVIVQSFSEASLRTLHAADPALPLVQLFEARETSESIRARLDSVAEYAVGIGPARRDVDDALVAAATERCLVVHPYTVNEGGEMERLLDRGVAGMFTDFPDRLDAQLKARGQRGAHAAERLAEWVRSCRERRMAERMTGMTASPE